ncbi:hypothetical protein HDV05_008825, partial [Chytridiales sp. JEL 0842]
MGGYRISKPPQESAFKPFPEWFDEMKQGIATVKEGEKYGKDGVEVVKRMVEGGVNVLDTSAHFGS